MMFHIYVVDWRLLLILGLNRSRLKYGFLSYNGVVSEVWLYIDAFEHWWYFRHNVGHNVNNLGTIKQKSKVNIKKKVKVKF